MNITLLEPPSFDGNEAMEILNVWLDRGEQGLRQKFAILPKISNDPVAWGLILVDIRLFLRETTHGAAMLYIP